MDNIKTIVNAVIGKMAVKEIDKSKKIDRIWENTLGKQEYKHTRLEGINVGVVSVLVDSPAWLYQMRVRKRRILERLQKEIENIKDIKFKIGRVNG